MRTIRAVIATGHETLRLEWSDGTLAEIALPQDRVSNLLVPVAFASLAIAAPPLLRHGQTNFAFKADARTGQVQSD